MSRHRAVRNLDLDAELAEDAGSDFDEEREDPYENITEQEAADLQEGLSATRDVLGDEETSGFSDRELKDALWDKYFDVEAVVGELLEEKSRREAKAKKKAAKEAARKTASGPSSKAGSGASTPTRDGAGVRAAKSSSGGGGTSGGVGLRKAAVTGSAAAVGASGGGQAEAGVSALQRDVEAMGLSVQGRRGGSSVGSGDSPRGSVAGTPKLALSHERVIEEWRKREAEAKKQLSIVVVGHVDAGKSTLMGRILHELGVLSDREHANHERASAKIGKGSFAYAWALDSSEEERERGVTIDVAQDSFETPNRHFTLLDAPGHRDFIPNMISGAAQADAAMLVIDAVKGAFEAGFGAHGQTREHAVLVRSLGVQQLVIVVNKMDAVEYSKDRFEHIVSELKPFLASAGFDSSKLVFVPCGGAVGENLSQRSKDTALASWYDGPTLVDVLDNLSPPPRQIEGALRMPITNVFRGQTAVASGVGASGRILGGLLTVGDRLRVVPGEECGIVRAIEQDGETVPWAVAGSSVTVYLAGIDIIHVNIGSVLCPPTSPVPLATRLTVQLLVFEPSLPLLAGTSLELFHHSSNLAATLTELVATLDPRTGAVIKRKPRVLSKTSAAKVVVTVASSASVSAAGSGGGGSSGGGVPIEPFATNREMGRVLLRRNGETVAAGIVLECQ